MRITPQEQHFIKNYWQNLLPNSVVYLFGSRANDLKKGGDIDLLILNTDDIKLSEKINFLSAFMLAFQEQKIDIVTYTYKQDAPFKSIALSTAIKL